MFFYLFLQSIFLLILSSKYMKTFKIPIFPINIINIIFYSAHQTTNEWSVNFYTGSRFLAGTSADINIQLNGNLGNSEIIVLKPTDRMPSGSVKKFNFIVNNNVGKVESLTIRLQPLVPLIYDWNLYKVSFFDNVFI
jgi:hypothetical protein